ncbi:TRAFs-binding domain-containing protein [Trichlorobacter sp.]|uniref:TRAFs-binding domain-containing protein n=1 Tax=Trichlorobacter sp. TaxID=2911007 RepID=UPI002A367ABB|nr:TRAFs-binding domain-containing protein [Trichlorobacter sp.]MDY0384540.1 TRAFs-binding domain-containing protein [Trichlorobacter sp.]
MNTFVGNLRQDVLISDVNKEKLENDLRNLDKVYGVGATEAVVFYCARILEAILKEAHVKFFEMNSKTGIAESKLVEMESALYEYNLLQQNRYYWAKGLRLLGNEVRHSLRKIKADEADCALVFLEFILVWYFCEFPLGPRQNTIYKGQARIDRAGGNLLPDLAWTLDSSRLNPEKLKVIFGPHGQDYFKKFSTNFTFPLLLIDIFIAQGDHTSAARLIEGLESFAYKQKGALRYRFFQLQGLLLSREDRLDEAMQLLEKEDARLRARSERIDVETTGILAGVYKRIWKQRQDEGYLRKSYETYRRGWRDSKNTYLGINAATTSLWLNNPLESQQIAKEIKGILEQRRKLIQQKTDNRYDLNYWDMATLAEACLLTHDLESSVELYQRAFKNCKNQPEDIDVTRRQRDSLIEGLSVPASVIERLRTL